MAFKKGKSGNPNGRKRGVGNIITTEIREALIEKIKPDISKYYSQIEDIENVKDRIDIYIKMLQLVLPKQKEVDLSGDIGITSIKVNIVDGNTSRD